MKSNDGVGIFFKTMKSGKVYIKLRATVEIDGVKENKIVSTGIEATKENVTEVSTEARPLFFKKLGIQLHKPVTVEEFYEEALLYININSNKETSDTRKQRFEDYVLPYFGKQDVKLIEAGAVESWQLKLKDQGVSNDLIRRSKTLLKRMFKRAIMLGYRKDNPTESTSTIRDFQKAEHEIYSKEEIMLMVAHADGWMKVFVLVFATLWLRSGEIIVLKWSDVNWTNETLTVNRAIRRGTFRVPKNGSRVIEIPSDLLSILKSYFLESKTEWIFPNKTGTHYNDSSAVNKRYFQKLLKKANVKYKGMYELKHGGISLSFSESLDPNFISSQAGHKDKATFLKYYAKFTKNKESIKKANEILNFNT